MNPYTFAEPTSPHIISADEGRPIDFAVLSAGLRALERQADWVLVEGAGGWFTPLSADQTFADWVQIEQLPVILVVGVKLGCINHAMLTAQAVQQAGLRLAGWIANDVVAPGRRHQEYLATLKRVLPAPFLGEIRGWLTRPGALKPGITSISASCLQRHPVGDKLVVQLVNVALGHVTPAIQHAKALRDPADKRQLLLS